MVAIQMVLQEVVEVAAEVEVVAEWTMDSHVVQVVVVLAMETVMQEATTVVVVAGVSQINAHLVHFTVSFCSWSNQFCSFMNLNDLLCVCLE